MHTHNDTYIQLPNLLGKSRYNINIHRTHLKPYNYMMIRSKQTARHVLQTVTIKYPVSTFALEDGQFPKVYECMQSILKSLLC
ncbi:hypothetical protein TorRG33x02_136550 [Trema orientale]|uniref:Uncharacterized protein n=1 Tax=Trema orientale TaxID=63057 RepID=A0A2P5EYJ0_TREOI|nr:hypothetical protein TorRG33x02_136550 [Trema orientale]